MRFCNYRFCSLNRLAKVKLNIICTIKEDHSLEQEPKGLSEFCNHTQHIALESIDVIATCDTDVFENHE